MAISDARSFVRASPPRLSSPKEQSRDQQYPPLHPPSPTLTNPDMILPVNGDDSQSYTSSPPLNLPPTEHPQLLRTLQNQQQVNGDPDSESLQIGVAISSQDRPVKRAFQRRWLFEGHEGSRPLSDIGEEDLSVPERMRLQDQDLHLMPFKSASEMSLSLRRDEEDPGYRESRQWSSSSSSSTISRGSDSSQWRAVQSSDSNTSPSGDRDSVHLDDGNGSVVESAEVKPMRNVMSVTEKDGPNEDLSTAILSSEAERILENAKKRLSLMEGNLSRARSSVRLSPSLSSSPWPSNTSHSSGFNKPVGGLYRSISRSDRKPFPLRPRQLSNISQDANGNRHSRVQSETNFSSTAQTDLPARGTTGLSRSASAMGSATTSNFFNDGKSFRYDPNRAYLTHRASESSMRTPGSDEKSPSLSKEGSTGGETSKCLGISTESELSKASSMEALNSASPPGNPQLRAQSQMSVRDLKDQMKGLQIKITSLKVKTQEDNLRRRSMQSLRGATSPFTAADQWYTNALEYRDSKGNLRADTGQGCSPGRLRDSPRSETYQQSSNSSERRSKEMTPRGSPRPTQGSASTTELTAFEDSASVAESLYEDAMEGDANVSVGFYPDAANEAFKDRPEDDLSESLAAFPSVPQSLEATPHEEREDAFDYEHFILHSALGNFSQAKLRRASTSSNGSVETTRPLYSAKHSRANSTTSLSSVGTFATATEGQRRSDDDDEVRSVLYWDMKFNDELRSQQEYIRPGESYQKSRKEFSDGAADESSSRAAQENPSGDENLEVKFTASHSAHPRALLSPAAQSFRSGPATPKVLASSLVSTVRAASSPRPDSATNGTAGLNHDDTRLLEDLFQSLGNVCMELQTITTAPGHDPKAARLLRRRLDAARRVLDGELDA